MNLSHAWEVLTLFLIPIGGGIPAGVLLARNRGIPWFGMTLLYFISDLILACVFEPLMKFAVIASKRSPVLSRVRLALKQSTEKVISHYGKKLSGPKLVFISFGVDPMTGRAASAMAGYGFFPGWAFAITGDLFYFALLMGSTLWLNSVLGDGTGATLIILALMTIVPILLRRIRGRSKKNSPTSD